MSKENRRITRAKNLSLASIIALIGFVSLGIVLAALFMGMWLDSQMGRRGPGIICLLVLSVPVSLFTMTRIALYLVKRIEPPTVKPLSHEKEE